MASVDPAAADDPSVCYRHPERQSWVLCQRCGRTICPECQILAPVGVQCPECVREAGGSVQWTPRGGSKNKKPGTSRAPGRSRVGTSARSYFASTTGPHLSWIVIGASLALWVIGFFTQNLPIRLLGSSVPDQQPWEIWRYFTSFLTQVAVPEGGFILLTLLNLAIFAWFGPMIEGQLGRSRYAVLFLFSAVCGSAVGTLAGGIAYGLSGALFGVFAAFAITVMRRGGNVTFLLVLMGFNLVYTAVASTGALPQLIGGLLAGAGGWWLFEFHGDRSNRRAPYWQAAAIAGGLIVLSTLRLVAVGVG